ncbi:MAG TPA: MATE family efflux transporter [Fimbriiglobus sp.]|nr:MATE family efflux transporter [Fimbriiglobus sp.]
MRVRTPPPALPYHDPMTATIPPALASASKWRRVLGLALPALAQQLLLLAVQLYDQYLAGLFTAAHTAALNTANYLYWAASSYTVLVSVGATALVARFVGATDYKLANRAAGQALVLAVVCGVAAAVAGWFGLDPLVRLLGLEDEAARYAVAYLRPLAALLPFYVVEIGGIACLVGAGDTRTGLATLAGVVAVNVPLSWTLAHGPLGFVGIAWGTGVCHTLGALFVVGVLAVGRYGLRLHLANLVPDAELLVRLLRVSVPAAADSLSTTVGQLWFLSIVNALGNVAASAHGIAIRVEALGYLSGVAFATAAMSLVGQNLGARQPGHAARDAGTALAAGCALMSVMGAVFYAFAPDLMAAFAPETNRTEVIATGVPALRLVAFAMPAVAAVIIVTAALRGAGDTRVPVAITWTGFLLVRIPLAYWLTSSAVGLGLMGAWWAMFADLYLRAGLLMARFTSGKWKTIKV